MAEIDPYKAASSEPAPAIRHAEPAILLSGIFAWLGVQVCFLLLQKHVGIRSLFCPSQAGCDAIMASRYSAFLGIPLPRLGAAFYLLLLALLLVTYAARTQTFRITLLGISLWLTIAGVSFSAMLMYVQFGILHAFCPLCTTSALLMLGLAVAVRRAERLAMRAPACGSRSEALALASFAAISAAVLIVSSVTPSDEVVAVVDGHQFTRSQMEQELGTARQSLSQAIHALEIGWVTRQVDAALLAAEAKRRRTSVEEMVAAKVRTLTSLSDQEIGQELAKRGQSAGMAATDVARRELATSQLVGEVAANHQIEINLKKPPLKFLRSDLSTAKLAGPRDAPIELVVFSDFQCEICAQLAPVLKRIRTDFPREVLLAYRYFPLESHPRALPAAIAAECAAEQGAFWEYHDKLFAEGGDLSDAKLRRLAAESGLDEQRFVTCLNADEARKVIEFSYHDAVESGLDGAPSLFLDGRMIGGLLDYETLAELIRKRLREKSASAP
jgi:protein-disulfide isomerase/uncharacterized membrane protein